MRIPAWINASVALGNRFAGVTVTNQRSGTRRAAQRPRDERPTLARLPEKKDTDLRLNAVDIDGDNFRSRWSDAWQRTRSLGSYTAPCRVSKFKFKFAVLSSNGVQI